MWDRLRRIKPNANEPWLMIGDLSEAMWQSEHISRKKISEPRMKAFRDVLPECNLHDLGFKEVDWTYNNNQSGEKNVQVRLDIVAASP